MAEQTSVKEFLREYLHGLKADDDKTVEYTAAFVDLNDDGTREAIVYLRGQNWCGSGGCNTLVLAKNGDSWRKVTTITVTRPPIRVLKASSNGWHNISVLVTGGGIRPGYDAELLFNGKSYATNPSVPPARPLAKGAAGSVVITAEAEGSPLY